MLKSSKVQQMAGTLAVLEVGKGPPAAGSALMKRA